MSEFTDQIQPIVGRYIVRAEWTGNLSIDDEGYLLTFDDGSQILFSWYRAHDCVGVLHELRPAKQSVEQTICEHGRNITKFHCVDCGTIPLG